MYEYPQFNDLPRKTVEKFIHELMNGFTELIEQAQENPDERQHVTVGVKSVGGYWKASFSYQKGDIAPKIERLRLD